MRPAKLQAALDKLSATSGQTTTIAGLHHPACTSSAPIDPDYEFAGTILEELVVSVISRTTLTTAPAIDSQATHDGKLWRIAKVEPRPSSFALTLARP